MNQTAVVNQGGNAGLVIATPRGPKWQGTYPTVTAFPSASESVLAGDFAYAQSTARVYQLSGTSTWSPVTDPLGVATPVAPLALAPDGRTLSIPAASATSDGFMPAASFAKLAGVGAGATANSPDAYLLARVNHTGTQSADTLTDGASNHLLTTARANKLDSLSPTTTLTGDVTGTGSGSFATILAPSGVTAGTYGSASKIPVLTVDAKGRLTSVTLASLPAIPGVTAPFTYDSTSNVYGLPPASATVDGYMPKGFFAQIAAIQTTQASDEAAIAAIKAKTDVLAPNGAIRATANVSVSALAVGALGTYTVSVPGATVGMVASLAPPTSLVANLQSWSAVVTASGAVTIKFVASVAVLAGTQTFTILLQ